MMRTNIRKTILLLIIIGVLLLILFTFASIGYEQFTNVKNRQIQKAIELCQKISLKAKDISAPPSSLSGGNQQKVVIAKWLLKNSEIFIFDEPTRGIDVGAKNEIYKLMEGLIDQGKSIIMISSEMSELIGMSDRVMVMCDGRVTGFIDGDKANQENIMALATQFE